MGSKRVLIEGGTYHVTSRTNAKHPAFSEKLGRKIILLMLREAKEKFGFKLHNFCVMPNHFHLLITPETGTNLSKILHWIKISSSKAWNRTYNSSNHLWGARFYSRIIKDPDDYSAVYEYIDQNPVKAELVSNIGEWDACGAYYTVNDCEF